MIANLMSKADFEQGINIKNPFISRWKSITDIGEAIGKAHKLNDKKDQFTALLGIQTLCYNWKKEYKSKKGKSWKVSRRGQGVESLETEIAGLLKGTFSSEYGEFKTGLNQKLHRAGQAFSTITGVGAPGRPALRMPAQTRSLSSTDYILEFLEPQHRGKAAMTKALWDQSDSTMSFTGFVQSMNPDELRALDEMNGKGADGNYKWVKYLTDEERAEMELKPTAAQQNRFKRDMDDGPFDTDQHESEPGRMGWSIFAMDEHNHIYTHSKSVMQFHHSSFLGGKPVKSAGTLKVTDGAIKAITMASGHYTPGDVQALAICRAILVKISAKTGTEGSAAAQEKLSEILICPDFKNETFYNALEYLTAGADKSGLQSTGAP